MNFHIDTVPGCHPPPGGTSPGSPDVVSARRYGPMTWSAATSFRRVESRVDALRRAAPKRAQRNAQSLTTTGG